MGYWSLVILAGAAMADKLTVGQYELYNTINSGGMTLTSGQHELTDSKGEGVAGQLNVGSYTLTFGLYGLLGEGTGEVVTGEVFADNGYIRTVYIFPEANQIKITWEYKDGTVTGADIYRLIAGEFSKDHDQWTKIGTVTAPNKSHIDSNGIALADGQTAYYMVMPYLSNVAVATNLMFDLSPAIPGDYIGKKNGIPYVSWPVAKIDYAFGANETKLMGYQFGSTGPSGFLTKFSDITALAGFNNGSVWVNKGGLQRYNYSGGWSGDFDVALAEGYWLLSANAATYSFTGALINAAHARAMTLGSDMYSYALPVAISENTGFVSGGFASGDSIWINKGGLQRLNYTGSWSGSFTLTTGDGFWYKTDVADKKLTTIP